MCSIWNGWTASTYGDVFLQPEYEHSKYTFEVSDSAMLFRCFHV